MRILFLNTDYPRFLASLYRQQPTLALREYGAQLAARNATLFGTADFMSRLFAALGHAAIDVHANNSSLQEAWTHSWRGRARRAFAAAICQLAPARIHPRAVTLAIGSARSNEILQAQIREFRPTILYNHDPSIISADWLKAHIPSGCALVGQIASPRNPATNWKAYDLMISSLPNFVAAFRREGIAAEYLPLCFEETVLDRLPSVARDIPLSFIGSLSPAHAERLTLVESVAILGGLSIWGEGRDRLPANSPIRLLHRGEAWGPAMFTLLRRSRLTLNKHIDIAEGYANNMRLFEATGMGACLVTDRKDNLAELFVPGKEVVTYDSPGECAEVIRYYVAHDGERARIAEAGQQRCLRDHSYRRRMGQLSALLQRNFD